MKISCFPYLVEKLNNSIFSSVFDAAKIFSHPKLTKVMYIITKIQSIPAKILFCS